MGVGEAIIVGIVQGLTEFLPVSSSAHIVYAQHFLGITEGGVDLAIMVHFGTLVAVFTAMWYRISPVVRDTCIGVNEVVRGSSPWHREGFRWAAYIVGATIPAGVLGLLFEDPLKETFGDPWRTSILLLVTGLILFATKFVRDNNGDLGWRSTLAVGFAQALAILPGISRSGSTISMGLFARIGRQRAAEFSFLLSIPVILGGTLIHLVGMVRENGLGALVDLPLLAGFGAAALSGYLAIRVLLTFIKNGAFHWFAIYCWAVGGTGAIYFG